jgi:phosphohistidine phosphatase SixA
MSNAVPDDKMLRLLWTPVTGAVVVFLFLSLIWVADHSLASAVQNDGSNVLLMRHGDAPGRSEPAGFDINDCSTQRNLSDKGRNEARDLGAMIRTGGINVTKILTSRFCRARETAKLMGLGPVEIAAAFDDLSFNKQNAKELLDDERKLIESWHGPGVLLVVSHGSNVRALTGIDLEQGGMLAVTLKQGSLFAKPFGVSPAIATLNCPGCF